MEFMIAWFWLVKVILMFIMAFVLYKAVKWNFKSKLWNILSIIVLVLAMITPLKIVPETDKVNTLQNSQIEQSKVLPEMVKDESFKKSTNIDGITKTDLK